MTIASAIQTKQQQVADAYTAVNGKGGTLPATQNLSNLPTAINSITELKGETKTVTPTTSQQTITPSSGKNGITQVTVNAVTNAIDSDIKASNIKSGVNILGVNGTVTELAGETRTVSLTSSSSSGQTFTPSSGKNGITSITVKANNQARTVTPSTSSQSLTVNSGYSGNGTITINAVTSSIDANITAGNIKSGVSILGVSGTYEGGVGITREVSAQGVYQIPTSNSSFSLPSGATKLGAFALYYAFYQSTGLTTANLSSLTTVNSTNAMQYAFYKCTTLANLDLSSLTTVSGSEVMMYAFQYCSTLANLDLSSLTTVSGYQAMTLAFSRCTKLTSVDLSNLTTVSGGSQPLGSCFAYDSKLTSVDLSSLTSIATDWALRYIFRYCTSLATLSFPSLKSTSFGSYTNQFNYMLQGVTGCTVHFPSNLQSVIGSWSDVTSGFGGTNTTVLFDLTATT